MSWLLLDKNGIWRLVNGVEGPAKAEEMQESQSSLLRETDISAFRYDVTLRGSIDLVFVLSSTSFKAKI